MRGGWPSCLCEAHWCASMPLGSPCASGIGAAPPVMNTLCDSRPLQSTGAHPGSEKKKKIK